MTISNFNDLDISSQLLQAILDKGFETPTPIQAAAIPLAIEGHDILGQAQTGTGKTAAFGIPILNTIEKGEGIQSLIICPTRELAVQVADEIASISKKVGITTLAVYGGQSIDLQIKALKKGPEIIVGTPGRLLDHLNRKTVRLNNLKIVVLDEADEMLNMGFIDDIKDVLKKCPEDRQTFLFSATFPTQVKELAVTFMKQPKEVKIKAPELTVPLIEQRYYEVNPRQKVETLCRVLDVEHPPVCIIFCRTKRGVDELVSALEVRGYAAEALHGDLSQRERDVVINRFRNAKTEILVATDVAARGLDITHVTHVFNYDIPQDPDSYVHRIGRTGRAGRQGIAITLVEPREVKQLRFIERLTKKQITRHVLPSFEDALKKRQQVLGEKLVSTLDENLNEYLDIANELLQEYDSTKLVAAALKYFANQGRQLETSEIKGVKTSKSQVKIPVGRNAGVKPKSLVHLICDNTSLRPKQVGDIEIFQSYTLVEVPEEFVDEVYEATRSLGKGTQERSRKKTLPPGVKPTGKDRPTSRKPAGGGRGADRGADQKKRTRKRPEAI